MHNLHPLIILQILSLLAIPTLSLPTNLNLAPPGKEAVELAPQPLTEDFPAYLHDRQNPKDLEDEIAKYSNYWSSGTPTPVAHPAKREAEAVSFAEADMKPDFQSAPVEERQLPKDLEDEIAKFPTYLRDGATAPFPVADPAKRDPEALSFADVHERQLPKAVSDAIDRYSGYWHDRPIPVQQPPHHHGGKGKREAEAEAEAFGFAEPASFAEEVER